MGSPAASADVQPSGRSALDVRSQRAPEPAVHPPLPAEAANSSYSTHVPCWSASTWASLPASTGALSGMGYGPGSLWAP